MVVNCFFPTLSCQFIKKKHIMHVAFFQSSVKNAYIPAMRVLSRIHSSCAFNISIFLNLSERKGNIQSCHQHCWEMKS